MSDEKKTKAMGELMWAVKELATTSGQTYRDNAPGLGVVARSIGEITVIMDDIYYGRLSYEKPTVEEMWAENKDVFYQLLADEANDKKEKECYEKE